MAVLGYVSTLTEIMIAVPQLYSNYVCGSVDGVSKVMIGIWTVSDIFKTIYFIGEVLWMI